MRNPTPDTAVENAHPGIRTPPQQCHHTRALSPLKSEPESKRQLYHDYDPRPLESPTESSSPTSSNARGHHMTDTDQTPDTLDELGPVDWIVVEFPGS